MDEFRLLINSIEDLANDSYALGNLVHAVRSRPRPPTAEEYEAAQSETPIEKFRADSWPALLRQWDAGVLFWRVRLCTVTERLKVAPAIKAALDDPSALPVDRRTAKWYAHLLELGDDAPNTGDSVLSARLPDGWRDKISPLHGWVRELEGALVAAGPTEVDAVSTQLASKSKLTADAKTDARKKSLPQGHNLAFCVFLKSRLDGKEPAHGEIVGPAREFIKENPACDSEPESLTRKARNHKYI